MMTATFKTTKARALGIICVVLAVIIAVILFVFGGKEQPPAQEAVSRRVTDNKSRVEFISSFGWKPEEEPSSVGEVLIPQEFDDVLTQYNELQKAAGMDLTPYLGNTVKKYSYAISDYPGGGEAFATIYVYDGTVIAADVSSHTGGGQSSIDGK